MRRLPLTVKALAALVLVFAITMVATGVAAARRIDENLTGQFEARGRAIAEGIASSSVEVMLFRDFSTIQAMIDQYLDLQGASYVYVVDAHGEVIAHTFVPGVPEDLLATRHQGPGSATRQVRLPDHEDYLDVSAPILGGRVGQVYVGMNRAPIRAEIHSAIAGQLALMALIFAMSLLVAFYFLNRIVYPLDRLTQYARTLAARDAATADVEAEASLAAIAARGDEVGELARAFRHTAGEVARREDALRQARDELDARVRERTADLARANAALARSNAGLEQFAAELARSNRELELFASVASHDLQEPLRMVSSFVDLLAQRYRGSLDDKADRWIAYMVDGTARMKQLINDLLEFARVSTRAKAPEPADFNALLAAALGNLHQAIHDTGAVVTSGPLPTVRVDATQMTQVLQNLIGNALKFHGPEPPRVHVEAQPDAAGWRFAVRDNGIGLDPQFAERVFVIFQRLHNRDEYPGTGIGLALCKKIVERHGGRIWVESRPGQGATFYFTVPGNEN